MSDFAFILLDCPPSLGPLTVNALVAADRVIVPVQTEYFALEGLAGLLDTLCAHPARAQPALDRGGHAADDARRAHEARPATSSARSARTSRRWSSTPSSPATSGIGEAPSYGVPVIHHDPHCVGGRGLLRAREGGGRAWLSVPAAWAGAWPRSLGLGATEARRRWRRRAARAARRPDHAEPASAPPGTSARSRWSRCRSRSGSAASCSPCSSAPAAGGS